MTYDNAVPQSNQQISTTQPIIQANFDFLEDGIGVEHNFNAAGTGTDMYHTQVSMPNKALSPVLPAGTNGQYFVSSAKPYFWDGSKNYLLNPFQEVLTGTYTPTSSSIYNNIVLLPANVQGFIIFENTSLPAGQMGTFITNANTAFGFSSRMKLNGSSDDYPIELNNNNSGSLQLQGRYFSSTYNVSFTFKVFYRPV